MHVPCSNTHINGHSCFFLRYPIRHFLILIPIVGIISVPCLIIITLAFSLRWFDVSRGTSALQSEQPASPLHLMLCLIRVYSKWLDVDVNAVYIFLFLFFLTVQDLKRTQGSRSKPSEEQNVENEASKNVQKEESVFDVTPKMCRSVKRKSSYKISIDPECDETAECNTFGEHEDQPVLSGDKDSNTPAIPTELGPVSETQSKGDDIRKGEESSCPVAVPVPAPRGSKVPVPKPRRIHSVVSSRTELKESQDPTPDLTNFVSVPVTVPENDEDFQTPSAETENGPKTDSESKPKASLKKLQLSAEEKTQLIDFTFSQDSDSETPVSSSSTSSSSRPQDGGGAEEEGYSSGGASWGYIRQKRLCRALKKKEEAQRESQLRQGRIRSKFSPWNLSSPRLQHRFSVLRILPAGTEIFQLILTADLARSA